MNDTNRTQLDDQRSPLAGPHPPLMSPNPPNFGPPGYGSSPPPGYGQSNALGAPVPPRKRGLGTGAIVAIVIGSVLALLLVLGIVAAVVSPSGDKGAAISPQPAATAQATSEPATTPPATATAPVAPPAASAAVPPALSATIGEGTYEVGVEIAPGQYKSAGASESAFMFCSWSIKGDSGEVLDVGAASGATEQQIVTLKQGQVFQSSGCKDWTKTK